MHRQLVEAKRSRRARRSTSRTSDDGPARAMTGALCSRRTIVPRANALVESRCSRDWFCRRLGYHLQARGLARASGPAVGWICCCHEPLQLRHREQCPLAVLAWP
jgi:hypothetical protein